VCAMIGLFGRDGTEISIPYLTAGPLEGTKLGLNTCRQRRHPPSNLSRYTIDLTPPPVGELYTSHEKCMYIDWTTLLTNHRGNHTPCFQPRRPSSSLRLEYEVIWAFNGVDTPEILLL